MQESAEATTAIDFKEKVEEKAAKRKKLYNSARQIINADDTIGFL